MKNETIRPVALTGDRPTGTLHLGHLAGSLATRVAMQDASDLNVMIADMQALTDNARDPARIRDNVVRVAADYAAAGLDPAKCVVFLQSGVRAIDRLAQLYANLVSVARLERNPTVRAEIAQRGFGENGRMGVPAGFLAYPVAQAADVTAFGATLVPIGEDQLPILEIANEIGTRVNEVAGRRLIAPIEPVLSRVPRLPGVDGRAKASKSLGNAIALDAAPDELRNAVMAMYTDPDHVRVSDPGRVEGNVVFAHLRAFHGDQAEVDDLEAHYRRGGLGDVALKRILIGTLEGVIAPMRERRVDALRRPDDLVDALRDGTARAIRRATPIVAEIEEALGVFDVLARS